MMTIGEIADKVRSKNAGPFWLTIDIFCADDAALLRVAKALPASRVARLFGCAEAEVKRFTLPDIHVLKLSVPRPWVQGSLSDRDMHGASFAALVAELPETG
ncbi:MAG: DUF4387 family protein [Alphaproteobacteria bacterium]|nr:MAG: DUF4387 family protein [Alphaproteobacteria bacterium]